MNFPERPSLRVRARGFLALAAVSAAALLSGCAAPGMWSSGAPVGVASASAAPLIAVPPTSVGTWYDLGHVLAPWMAGDAPVPVSGPEAPTRLAGLRREDGRWLAIVIAQVAPSGGAPCPLPNSLHVVDTGSSADGCLRLRRDADFDRWLERQHSVLYQWLEGREWSSRPRAWVSYRLPAAGGGRAIETHALLNPVLLEPTTRNNDDFLAGGQPGLQWARAFAAATRASSGGVLNVPPFPFAPQVGLAAPPVVVAPPPPVRATQEPSRTPVQAPRRDRE
jgi:hypothetical protein